jgi:hypothetical protein
MNITNHIFPPHIKNILTNYGVNKNESPTINPPNKENPFNEKEIVAEIYSALYNKKYDLLFHILSRLPNFNEITELYLSFVRELQKYNYTDSQLKAISTLLYRLSNIKFASVKSPKPFPLHSIPSILYITRNKELKNAKKIDSKIKEIVKNMITYYKLEIKNNKNYNSSNDGRLALKLRNILLSFIIEYTKPESNNTLEVKSVFPPVATRNQRPPGENRWSEGVRILLGEKNE